jgi:lipoprotein-anchoring transpeptidase ErfK/SrfK
VPVFPASHGCFRLPIPDARTVFNWMKIGTPVDVYR